MSCVLGTGTGVLVRDTQREGGGAVGTETDTATPPGAPPDQEAENRPGPEAAGSWAGSIPGVQPPDLPENRPPSL